MPPLLQNALELPAVGLTLLLVGAVLLIQECRRPGIDIPGIIGAVLVCTAAFYLVQSAWTLAGFLLVGGSVLGLLVHVRWWSRVGVIVSAAAFGWGWYVAFRDTPVPFPLCVLAAPVYGFAGWSLRAARVARQAKLQFG
ncbi:MAG TPA: hypothetical protein VEQ63_15695 [Bryobacteraceae bacterium]|nr:hypothetical protein [Bryobacteraceae bacterium]